jgi:hypothetical protein
MNKETVPNQAEKMNPESDPNALDPEILDRIKHPPAIDDVMRELDPQELIANPTMVPELLQEGADLRHDLRGKD